MSDQSSDRIEGMVDKAKGKAKETWGDLTNDETIRNEGEMDQASGEMKQRKADVKDAVDDLTDRAADKIGDLMDKTDEDYNRVGGA